MKHHPKPMPAVVDPYKYIMENHMPLDSTPLEGIHHCLRAEITDDGQVAVWVKDKHRSMPPSEAIAFARHILEKAGQADAEIQRRKRMQSTL